MDYNLIRITDSTVLSDAGICYYDPIEEVIKEIGSGYMMGTNPASPVIHKLMLVIKNGSIKKVNIKIVKSEELESLFDIKILPGVSAPGISSFSEIDAFNNLEISEGLQPYSLIPFHVYIKTKGPINALLNAPLELTYEF